MTVPPFGLRMSPDLHEQVKRAAVTNNRSMNAEIVARLEAGAEALRDRFAMAALASIAAEWGKRPMETPDDDGARLVGERAARMAYHFADAMLAERSKP